MLLAVVLSSLPAGWEAAVLRDYSSVVALRSHQLLLTTLVNVHHRALRELMFRNAGDDLLSRVVSVCSGFADSTYGACVAAPSTDVAVPGSVAYHRLGFFKFRMLLAALSSTERVFWCDSDTVLLANPLPDLERYRDVLWFSSDWRKCGSLCGCRWKLNIGALLVSRRHRAFLTRVLGSENSTRWDQDVATRELQAEESCVLPLRRFAGHKWVGYATERAHGKDRFPQRDAGFIYPEGDGSGALLRLCDVWAYHATSCYTLEQKLLVMRQVLEACNRSSSTTQRSVPLAQLWERERSRRPSDAIPADRPLGPFPAWRQAVPSGARPAFHSAGDDCSRTSKPKLCEWRKRMAALN